MEGRKNTWRKAWDNNSSHIQKKGERVRCENYRGIALVNAAYRILAITILGKIKPYVKNFTDDYQNGYRNGRSAIDNIFAFNIINNKTSEYDQSVHDLFIDFQNAYGSLHRHTLWKSMEEFKIPKINMCRAYVQKTISDVRVEGTLSLFFENETGMKQGEHP